MAVRTFLAIDLDEDIRQRILAVGREIDVGSAKLRWVADGQLHVTLRFLGDVQDNMVPEVCERAAAATTSVEPFDFAVRGVLPVPPDGRQLRMFWVGIEDVTGRMAALHDALAAALSGMGLKEEARRFQPHVTLARVKFCPDAAACRQAAEPYRQEDFGTQHAAQVVAHSSRLTPRGPVYTALARTPLGR